MKIPIYLDDYLNYMETIKGTSSNTVKEYYFDLRTFFRFLKIRYKLVSKDIIFNEIEIDDFDIDLLRKVNIQDLHAYISYIDKTRGNSNTTRARKVASVRSFFKYLHSKVNLIDSDPAVNLEFPKLDARHPTYLTLDQAQNLLNTVLNNTNELYKSRDYAIIMLFLNCGLRLSELSSINLDKVNGDDNLTVIGKGNKERTIFLNEACVLAINEYLKFRPIVPGEKALFLSKRRQRMSNRAIQHMIDKYIEKAGFDPFIYSVHKLRHTAATLMYKYGNVDIRALQEILGHESVATTQIYTHLDDDRLRKAVKSNPLSNRKINTKSDSNK